jgi:hypothetical protein
LVGAISLSMNQSCALSTSVSSAAFVAAKLSMNATTLANLFAVLRYVVTALALLTRPSLQATGAL